MAERTIEMKWKLNSMNYWMKETTSEAISESMNEWFNQRISECLNRRSKNERMNERDNEWITSSLNYPFPKPSLFEAISSLSYFFTELPLDFFFSDLHLVWLTFSLTWFSYGYIMLHPFLSYFLFELPLIPQLLQPNFLHFVQLLHAITMRFGTTNRNPAKHKSGAMVRNYLSRRCYIVFGNLQLQHSRSVAASLYCFPARSRVVLCRITRLQVRMARSIARGWNLATEPCTFRRQLVQIKGRIRKETEPLLATPGLTISVKTRWFAEFQPPAALFHFLSGWHDVCGCHDDVETDHGHASVARKISEVCQLNYENLRWYTNWQLVGWNHFVWISIMFPHIFSQTLVIASLTHP